MLCLRSPSPFKACLPMMTPGCPNWGAWCAFLFLGMGLRSLLLPEGVMTGVWLSLGQCLFSPVLCPLLAGLFFVFGSNRGWTNQVKLHYALFVSKCDKPLPSPSSSSSTPSLSWESLCSKGTDTMLGLLIRLYHTRTDDRLWSKTSAELSSL